VTDKVTDEAMGDEADDLAGLQSPDTQAAYKHADRQESVGMRALSGLFLLEHEFRRVPQQTQLARLVVNRLNRFAPYDCAIFWTSRGRRLHDVTISGVVKSKDTRPVLAWGEKLGIWLNKSGLGNTQITPAMISQQKSMAGWPENLPKSGLYVPLKGRDGQLRGGIVLLRTAKWSHPVRIMLDQLAEAAAYTVAALDAGVHGRKARRRSYKSLIGSVVVLALMAASFMIPVPINVQVPARLAVAASVGNAPRGPAQIDLRVPPQGAMALRPGSRLKTQYQGTAYELEVEHISPWLAGLFADRQIRARVVAAPDGLAPPALQSIMIENASMPLPLYVMRGPIRAMRESFNLD
jgi:hypothetical protein